MAWYSRVEYSTAWLVQHSTVSRAPFSPASFQPDLPRRATRRGGAGRRATHVNHSPRAAILIIITTIITTIIIIINTIIINRIIIIIIIITIINSITIVKTFCVSPMGFMPMALREAPIATIMHESSHAEIPGGKHSGVFHRGFCLGSFRSSQSLLPLPREKTTYFSKSFSPFPHGTRLLSVSNPYLASNEIHRALAASPPRRISQSWGRARRPPRPAAARP